VRYLVLTDIHANLDALDACLADAARRGFDKALVLGDIVGYGAEPEGAIDRVRELQPLAIVRGNHDKVACGLDSAEGFNAVARAAVEWTRAQLSDADREWLAAMPKGPVVVDALIEICHGSPFDEDAYVFDELDARRSLEVASRPLCLYGHTHWPMIFVLTGGSLEAAGSAKEGEAALALKDGARYLLNPGAVGQPRDGDPRAAYAIVDADAHAVELLRIEYDAEAAREKIAAAGLPEILGNRLLAGR
jgi:diadenosine tetraphosphatase ApaH/serine/threonine PP2A family protein phosphatase